MAERARTLADEQVLPGVLPASDRLLTTFAAPKPPCGPCSATRSRPGTGGLCGQLGRSCGARTGEDVDLADVDAVDRRSVRVEETVRAVTEAREDVRRAAVTHTTRALDSDLMYEAISRVHEPGGEPCCSDQRRLSRSRTSLVHVGAHLCGQRRYRRAFLAPRCQSARSAQL